MALSTIVVDSLPKRDAKSDEALPEVVQRLPELRVLLVGGGPCHAEVTALVRELGLERTVIVTGRVPHAEVDR